MSDKKEQNQTIVRCDVLYDGFGSYSLQCHLPLQATKWCVPCEKESKGITVCQESLQRYISPQTLETLRLLAYRTWKNGKIAGL